jgi:hypothetical protein
MNLICFPHYTCGGLLCDIFENTFSKIGSNGGLASFSHAIGKIGDSADIFDEFDVDIFNEIIKNANNEYIGTHCHPSKLNLMNFNRVYTITTTTFKSKIYRWARTYHHYFSHTDKWKNLNNLARIDKERETAKNYIKSFNPVIANNVINIEFAEVVENSINFQLLTIGTNVNAHLDRWRSNNKFLYDQNFWTSNPVKRFYEAEYEVNLNQEYVYQ